MTSAAASGGSLQLVAIPSASASLGGRSHATNNNKGTRGAVSATTVRQRRLLQLAEPHSRSMQLDPSSPLYSSNIHTLSPHSTSARKAAQLREENLYQHPSIPPALHSNQTLQAIPVPVTPTPPPSGSNSERQRWLESHSARRLSGGGLRMSNNSARMNSKLAAAAETQPTEPRQALSFREHQEEQQQQHFTRQRRTKPGAGCSENAKESRVACRVLATELSEETGQMDHSPDLTLTLTL
jgi:hypothetical protein